LPDRDAGKTPPRQEQVVESQFEQRLAALAEGGNPELLRYIRRGIEKESLRITPDGRLAQTPHPVALGSALTHPHITTDYSEALLEFITSAGTELAETLRELEEIHRFVYARLGEEILWTSSMPCLLEDDRDIPIAHYGSSNVAKMKSVYRIGLSHRYGRLMQTIAGIHFNFSFDDDFWRWLHEQAGSDLDIRDFKTDQYFALIRNFHRLSWLLAFLFGASPALCRSFVRGRSHSLESLSRGTLYAPHGTSLRMGDLGYQSLAQAGIDIPYDGLDDYIGALEHAITQPHPEYVKIGVRDGAAWLQLSTSLLQIENEFYSSIRPKRVTRSGEPPRRALRERGVEYVEVRCLDIDPFEPAGIGSSTARFVDAFLVYCLLRESPPSDAGARRLARENLQLVVNRGREPGLKLHTETGGTVPMAEWASKLVDDIEAVAQLLDDARKGSEYAESLKLQRAKIEDPALTPSARIIEELRRKDISYFRFAMEQSLKHRDYFLAEPLSTERQLDYERLAAESIAAQHAIEANDRCSFEQYLADYFIQ